MTYSWLSHFAVCCKYNEKISTQLKSFRISYEVYSVEVKLDLSCTQFIAFCITRKSRIMSVSYFPISIATPSHVDKSHAFFADTDSFFSARERSVTKCKIHGRPDQRRQVKILLQIENRSRFRNCIHLAQHAIHL